MFLINVAIYDILAEEFDLRLELFLPLYFVSFYFFL